MLPTYNMRTGKQVEINSKLQGKALVETSEQRWELLIPELKKFGF